MCVCVNERGIESGVEPTDILAGDIQVTVGGWIAVVADMRAYI